MSLPLLIRQIFADLIINGPHQNFRFRSESSGVFHLKNEFVITDLIPAIMDLKIGDINHNSFTLRYNGFTDFSKNEFGLYVVKNAVLDPIPVFKINQVTKEFTFISKAYFTKDDGTTALIGTGGGSGGITQAQLDAVLQQAKDYAQSNTVYDYNSVADSTGIFIHHKIGKGNLLDLMVSGVMNQQGYVRTARLKINVSTKEWSFVIDSVDQYPSSSTTILSGTKDYVSLSLKQLKFLAPATDMQDAVIKVQLDNAISALNIPSGALATQSWVTAQNYLVSSALTNYATKAELLAIGNTAINGYFLTAFNTLVDQSNSQITNVGNNYTKERSQIFEIKIANRVRDGLDDPTAGDEIFFIRQPYTSGLEIGVRNNNTTSGYYADSSSGLPGLVHIKLKNTECTFKWNQEYQIASNKAYTKTYYFFDYLSTNYSAYTIHVFYKNVSYNTQVQNGISNSYGSYSISTPFADVLNLKTQIRFNTTTSQWELVQNDIVFNGFPQVANQNYVPLYSQHLTNKAYVDPGMVQIGGEITFPKNATLPSGYLQCNGANFSRTTYPALGSLYATSGRSTVYVSGDPQIALPNRTAPDAYSVVIVRAK